MGMGVGMRAVRNTPNRAHTRAHTHLDVPRKGGGVLPALDAVHISEMDCKRARRGTGCNNVSRWRTLCNQLQRGT